MWLRSDNVTGVSPEIWKAMMAAEAGDAPPYGDDAVTQKLAPRLTEIFEHDCIAFPVTTGIAANAMSLSLMAGPLEAAISHADAHVATSEAGAFEFFSQGARLITLPGRDGKLTAADVESFLAGVDFKRAASIPPRAITLTQATERGTLYTLEEIRAICAAAKKYGLHTHMDGARIANALATLKCSPADLTWRSGIDILSFGATKNGAMMADAVVIFDKALAATAGQRRRRSGQSSSKMRFMSAQLLAYVADDLWLRNARAANHAAKRISEGLAALPGISLAYPVEANMIFLRIDDAARKKLAAAKVEFRPPQGASGGGAVVRLVASFTTNDAMVDDLLGRCRAAFK